MESNKLPTAEEFAERDGSHIMGYPVLTINQAIQFAKLHVKEALKVASEKAEIEYSSRKDFEINKESILNSYPLDNIK